jgi:hypothetical protein
MFETKLLKPQEVQVQPCSSTAMIWLLEYFSRVPQQEQRYSSTPTLSKEGLPNELHLISSIFILFNLPIINFLFS